MTDKYAAEDPQETDLSRLEKRRMVEAIIGKATHRRKVQSKKDARARSANQLTIWGLSNYTGMLMSTPRSDPDYISATDGEAQDNRIAEHIFDNIKIGNFVNSELRIDQNLISITYAQHEIKQPSKHWCRVTFRSEITYRKRLNGILDRLTVHMK